LVEGRLDSQVEEVAWSHDVCLDACMIRWISFTFQLFVWISLNEVGFILKIDPTQLQNTTPKYQRRNEFHE
jgi:hypothetical protein